MIFFLDCICPFRSLINSRFRDGADSLQSSLHNPRVSPWHKLEEAIVLQDFSLFEVCLDALNPSQRASVSQDAEIRGTTLLARACEEACPDIVQRLIAEGASAAKLYSPAGSALHATIASALRAHHKKGYMHKVSSSLSQQQGTLEMRWVQPPSEEDYETTVNLLLCAGADPFLENRYGMHALDMLNTGCSAAAESWAIQLLTGGSAAGDMYCRLRRNLARQLQGCIYAPYSGILRIHLKPFTSRDWGLMWVAVVPRRYSQPYGSRPKARSHELWVYPAHGDTSPIFRLELDGCHVVREGGGVVRLLLLPTSAQCKLGSSPRAFHGTFMRKSIEESQHQERWSLSFRPNGQIVDSAGRPTMEGFIQACSACSEEDLEGEGGPTSEGSPAAAPGLSWPAMGQTATVTGSAALRVIANYGAVRGGSMRSPAAVPTYSDGVQMVLPIALAMAGAAGDSNGRLQGLPTREQLLQQADAAAIQKGISKKKQQQQLLLDDQAASVEGAQTLVERVSSPSRDECPIIQASRLLGLRSSRSNSNILEVLPCQQQAADSRRSKHNQADEAVGDDSHAATADDTQLSSTGRSCAASTTGVETGAGGVDAGAGPCVVCLLPGSARVGFKHGCSIHQCVCYSCARQVILGGEGSRVRPYNRQQVEPSGPVRCPMCRQPVEEVLAVF
ncbi:hypothetical protein CEUSTIGMA_g9332.t1 [Chlamydomonas eustigma]|uniref:Uncharacterized protein n=1 Tax=Chlamydomonas eustigma TaxID=1157962 RepID=A0A250XFQ0_9CHLO|nr:hypothetical protein CEUSTIGMA_g9332.t1 [Chlamydomonas eustigma]|eukprot:GAX81904.1 hypothetical protein CEUSTIGMA_g9332.t1 [Chlamydomonas eustigma]